MKVALKFLLFFFLFGTINMMAQNAPSEVDKFNYANRELRSGKLFFKLGGEYRVTPIYKEREGNQISPEGMFTNVDAIHSGPAFVYGLEYFINKNLSVSIEHSLRDEGYLYPFRSIEQDFGVAAVERGILHGFHAHINYHFPVFKDADLFLRLGISTYNGNSNFILKETIFNEDGQAIFAADYESKYTNSGLNLALGYKKKRLEILLGVYISDGGAFYNESFAIVTPYLRLTYTLGKL